MQNPAYFFIKFAASKKIYFRIKTELWQQKLRLKEENFWFVM